MIKKTNPLKMLQKHGQSVWLDYIRRSLITSRELKRMVDTDGVRGVTSNPTIFQKAIAGSSDYDNLLTDHIKTDPHLAIPSLFNKLAIQDIQQAADTLQPVYEKTDGADGFVSIEVSPHLAYDSEGTITEVRRLWKEINRPNIMIKVPATSEGIPAIKTLIVEGINVNITLIFSIVQYEMVANAYISGLEQCQNPHRVASVASFFVSRIDKVIDTELTKSKNKRASSLLGKIAIANAKIVYKRFKEIFSGDRWNKLVKRRARVQRLLWASTGTKNPNYSDVLYVEELIGRDTVNTMPPATLNAFRDHGKVQSTLEKNVEEAENNFSTLTNLEIDLTTFTEQLQIDGVKSFAAS
jgi:transaldolase